MRNKKNIIIAAVLVIATIGIAGVLLYNNSAKNTIDLSLWNGKFNVVESNADGDSITSEQSSDFINMLDCSKWRGIRNCPPVESGDDITAYDLYNDKNYIKIYEKRSIAAIMYNGKYSYFKIPENTYSNTKALMKNSKPVGNSIVEKFGYINSFDKENKTIVFDKVLWINEKDTELLKKYGYDESDLTNGYIVHNEYIDLKEYTLNDKSLQILFPGKQSEFRGNVYDTLESIIDEGKVNNKKGMFCMINIENGKVILIKEINWS